MSSGSPSATHWASANVETLDLTIRAYNCLRRAGVSTVGELVRQSPGDLLSIPAMGRTTVGVIQDALTARGLSLGMQDIDGRTCQAIDAFLEAMDLVRSHGVSRVADLVSKTPQEVAALPGVDGEAARHIEDGLAKWGLSLGTWSARDVTGDRTAEGVSEERSEPRDGAQTVRDELLRAVEGLLADRKPSLFRCFAAYHSVDGHGGLTLQDIGDRGPEYGFGARVSRERVRQVIAKAERWLRRRADRIGIANWARAVSDARERVPTTIERVVDAFGYRSCDEPAEVFSMLRVVADIFSREFPFDLVTIRGRDVVKDDGAVCVETMDLAARLTALDNAPYYDTTGSAEAVGCEVVALERVVGGPFGWEFLDEARRYFWMPPGLPPRDHAVTGNAILTGLCKVFSVAREATSVDLAHAISRDRGVRKTVPREVIEHIALRSELFELEGGALRRKAGQEWFCLGERDRYLLRVFKEHGRVVSSRTLYSSMVRYGLTRENAATVVAHSPFLVHAKAGQFHDEGIYKLVCRTEDVVMALGEGGREGTGRTGEADPHTEGAGDVVRIPVSPRVRLTGSHFAPEPINMDGEWRVLGVDGTVIGAVTLSGRLVEGLCSVIDALGLEMNAVLDLRRHGDGDLLAVRA